MESTERFISCIEEKDWDTLITILKPKDFCTDIPRTLYDFKTLLKVAEILTNKDFNISDKIKSFLLKCLSNSCVNGYLEKAYVTNNSENTTDSDNIYKFIFQHASTWKEEGPYPFSTNFPYDEVVRWAIKTVIEYSNERRLSEDQSNVLRLSLQFLCNFFTFCFNISTSSNADVFLEYIEDKNFINTIIKLVGHDHAPIARAACAYVHNMVKQLFKEFYATINKKELTTELIKSTISDIQAALDTVILLLKEPNYLKDIYDEVSIDDRLYLLDIIHQEARSVVYNEDTKHACCLPIESIEFLSEKFKKKSDLILKTVDTQLNDIEPTEVAILIDILGVLTSNSNLEECKQLQEDKSLLLNCVYLLRAIHMLGKESNNCFTSLQKLSYLALNAKDDCCNGVEDQNKHMCQEKIQSHPAFGFKASLVRVVGNLVHKHEKNQNLVRECDGIPLLLDCCNIDARNPLIIQWATLAIVNLVDKNLENQDVIRKSVKVGVVDSAVVRELGLTLHDEGDGKAIGIMPLPKNE